VDNLDKTLLFRNRTTISTEKTIEINSILKHSNLACYFIWAKALFIGSREPVTIIVAIV
jgi:hypothetical protein